MSVRATGGFTSLPAPSSAPSGGGEEGSAHRGEPFDVREEERYVIGGRIGQGGMGRVLSAHDRRLGRTVALKELLKAGPDAEARLLREARLTAELDHPGIVPVYDGGRTSEGRLFYTMRLVRGRTLGDLLRAAEDPPARLRLVRHLLEACRAVAFAHERRIVHRDLKPANILVGPLGESQVADWGLARRIGEAEVGGEEPSSGELTRAGSVMGTPRYLAPELARGLPADTRSDVWSLGAVLHEVLVGAPPWSEHEPEAAIQATRDHGAPPVLTRAPQAPPELAAIADRATRLDPADRYPSARDLAEDLSAWLEGRPVDAHQYSPFELLGRLLRAWRVPLTIGALALVATVLGVAGAWRETSMERDRAVEAKRTARRALDEADRRLAALLLTQARAAEAEDARPEAEVLAAHSLALDPSPAARGVLAAFAAQPMPRLLESRPLADCAHAEVGGANGWWSCLSGDALHLHDRDGTRLRTIELAARQVVFARDGEVALARGLDHALHLLTKSGVPVHLGKARSYGSTLGIDSAQRLAFSADRGTITVHPFDGVLHEEDRACGSADLQGVVPHPRRRELRIVCGDGTLAALTPEPWKVSRHRLDDDGLLAWATTAAPGPGEDILVGTIRGEIGRLDVGGRKVERIATLPRLGQIRSLRLSPDEGTVLVIGDQGGPTLIDVTSGSTLAVLPRRDRGSAAFLDGSTLVTASDRLAVWRWESLLPRRFLADGGLASVAVSQDGRTAVGVGSDGRAIAWSLESGRAQPLRLDWERTIKQVAFSPNGEEIALGGIDEPLVKILRLSDGAIRTVSLPSRVRSVGWLADNTLWTLGYGEGPFAWRHELPLASVPDLQRNWMDGATTADQRSALLLDDQGEIFRLDADGVEHLAAVRGATQVAGIGGGYPLFVALPRGLARFEAGPAEAWRVQLADAVTDLAISPDGRWLAAGTLRGEVLLLTTEDGSIAARLQGHSERAASVAFSADGTSLLSAGWDGAVRLWGLEVLTRAPEPVEVQMKWQLRLEPILGIPRTGEELSDAPSDRREIGGARP